MTIQELKSAWTEPVGELRPISAETLRPLPLTASAAEFLQQAGLPDEAAPSLSFVGDVHTAGANNCIDLLTNWFPFLAPSYSNYVVIGTDGSGDIIALNTAKDCIVEWLDHENDFSPRFMNSSILQLAHCLLAYARFVQTTIRENGEDAYIEARFTDTHLQVLYDQLKETDDRCVNEGFWYLELQSLQ